MAGSRLANFGTIFSRVQGLLKSGAMKEVDKPIWLDVYKAFPPRVSFKKVNPEVGKVQAIFYPEDRIRARFYTEVSPGAPIDLRKETDYQSLSQKFIERFRQLQDDNPNINEDKIFEQVVEDMNLKKTGYSQDDQEPTKGKGITVTDFLN